MLLARELRTQELAEGTRGPLLCAWPGMVSRRGKKQKNYTENEEDTEKSAQAIFVDGHADGGVHADFFEGAYFPVGFDSACGNDGMLCCDAEFVEPVEVGPGHGAFAVDVSAEEGGAEGFELGHYVFGTQRQLAPPAVDGDVAFRCVESDDNSSGRYCFCKLTQKANVRLAFAKSGAADDELVRAPFGNFLGTRDGSNAAAYADFEFVAFPRFEAEFAGQRVVAAGADGGVQVDKMQPAIGFESLQQPEHVGDGEFALAAVDKLHGLTALQIDAGDQHGKRTSMLCSAKYCFSARMDCVLSWKMEAARAASAAPSEKICAKCSGSFAPPEAMTGTVTAREIAPVSGVSKPICVPSRSTDVRRISPAPSSTPRCAHTSASRLAESRPPRTMTSQ